MSGIFIIIIAYFTSEDTIPLLSRIMLTSGRAVILAGPYKKYIARRVHYQFKDRIIQGNYVDVRVSPPTAPYMYLIKASHYIKQISTASTLCNDFLFSFYFLFFQVKCLF